MSSGQQALADMDARINATRQETGALAGQLQRLQAELEQARAQEGGHTQNLARLRLDLLGNDQVGDQLDAADRQAIKLLAQRREAAEKLQTTIAQSATRQTELTESRAAALATRDRLLAAHQKLFDEVGAAVRQRADWQAQYQRHLEAEQHAEAAAAKCQTAEADREQKRRPYEADRLFVYLWERRYGFPEYEAMPLIRTLDGWVARLCRYDGAHRNYRMLLALAGHLQAHAAQLKSVAEQALADLQQIEQQALVDAGFTQSEQTLAQSEAALLAAEQALEQEEANHQQLLAQRAAFAAGDDPLTRQALQVLGEQMTREDLQTLRQDARATTTPKDDALVAGLANARAQVGKLSQDIAQLQARQQVTLKSLQDAEELRRRFRASAYDSRDSEFGNGIAVGAVLGELLRGAVVLNDAWDQVHRNHRFRIPRHGGGGGGSIFGAGGWSGGGRSSGRSSGGFSTDKSFGGGGGFSTDDSF